MAGKPRSGDPPVFQRWTFRTSPSTPERTSSTTPVVVVAGVDLVAQLEDAIVALEGVQHRPTLLRGVGEWLLSVDVLPGLEGHHGHEGMPVVRRGAGDRVDVLAVQHPAEVQIRLGPAPGSDVVKSLHRLAEVATVDVTQCRDLDVLEAGEPSDVVPTHAVHAYVSHHDLVARRRCSRSPREQGEPGRSGCGLAHELASAQRARSRSANSRHVASWQFCPGGGIPPRFQFHSLRFRGSAEASWRVRPRWSGPGTAQPCGSYTSPTLMFASETTPREPRSPRPS